jgi:cell division transport system ATP-binding protein
MSELSIIVKGADIFQREQLVLSNVNFEIHKGEFVYLIGRVGSGKSSLIKTLNAEIPVFTGQVTVAGFDLQNIKTKDVPLLRRKLGVVFQDFKLLTDRPVCANLEFVLRATGWTDTVAVNKRIDEMLDAVSMLSMKNKMPHQLSGGEQQRVVIARALLNDPEIILADEPTGNLDPETSVEILQLFKKIHSQGRTVLMATHDRIVVDKFPARTLVCLNNNVSEMKSDKEKINFKDLL